MFWLEQASNGGQMLSVESTKEPAKMEPLAMKMILDVDTRAIGRDGWFWSAGNNYTGLILIEVVVVLAVAQRVFRSVEEFPNIRSNWTWICTRWCLQNNWFDSRRTR